MARRLSRLGGQRVTAWQVRALIRAGAPVGADGRVDVEAFLTWVAGRLRRLPEGARLDLRGVGETEGPLAGTSAPAGQVKRALGKGQSHGNAA